VAACEKAVRLNPKDLAGQLALTFAYVDCGRDKEARATAEKVLEIDPKFTLDNYAKRTLTYKNKEDTERFIAALSKAGLK
jgi:tetratricopeptide (TPR) repeat protein